MKIDGFGNITSTGATGKRKGVSQTGNFADLLSAADTDEAGQASQASDVGATAAMGSLLALQEIPDDVLQRKKTVQHGNNILDKLEKLRRQMLTGPISYSTLREIEQLTKQKQLINDPNLHGIMEEIELRAAVELAKLQQASLTTPVFTPETPA